jgi:hypothetical protein
VRTDLLEFQTPPFTGPWVEIIRRGGESGYLERLSRRARKTCTLAAVGLQNYQEYMAGRSEPLVPMTFPGNVVINHSDSMSHVPGGIGAYQFAGNHARSSWRTILRRLKQRLRWLPTLRVLTPALRREFSIPEDSEIPAAYLSSGSVFWR